MPDSIDDDQPLSVVTPSSAFMRDTSTPLNAATFDLDAFLGGMRPTRRTVKLHERADLIGVMDELANRIESAPADVDVDDLIDRFVEARAAFLSGVTYWTVEKRSSEWISDSRRAYAKEHGIKLNADDSTDDSKSGLAMLLNQVVGQVVEVKDADGAILDRPVTFDLLRAMYDVNEGEVNKLVVAIEDANTAIAQSAKVLSRDFSQRYSTSRSGVTS